MGNGFCGVPRRILVDVIRALSCLGTAVDRVFRVCRNFFATKSANKRLSVLFWQKGAKKFFTVWVIKLRDNL